MAEIKKEVKDRVRNELFSGERKVKCAYREGSPLSGYTIAKNGSMGEFFAEQEILVQLNIAKEVPGWGTKVHDTIIEQYGTEFFVTEFLNDDNQKEEKEGEKTQKELTDRQEEAKRDAEDKGKNVFISTVGMYDGDVERPGEELGTVYIREYATPEGEIVKKEFPTH